MIVGAGRRAHRVPGQFPDVQIRPDRHALESYGSKVTGAEVRNNPLTKVYLCQVYGGDTRLKGTCGAYSPDLYGR